MAPPGGLLPEPDFNTWRPLLDNVQRRTRRARRRAVMVAVFAVLAMALRDSL